MERGKMRKYICLLVAIMTFVVIFVFAVIAQQGDQQKQINQRFATRFDPGKLSEKLIEQRANLALKRLELSEEESDLLKPKLFGILKLHFEYNREMKNLNDELQKAIDTNSDEQIKVKLAEVKSKRKEYKAKVESQENEIIKSLKVKQEAQLTVLGIINSDNIVLQTTSTEAQEGREIPKE